jgi:formate-dependent nitrite reductase cytochrome c552 subunit
MPTEPTTGNSGLTGKFVGSERCVVCHSHVHLHWSATLHAGALETLEIIGQDKNPVCLECHTVGFGEPGGFVDRATTNDLAGVGCEDCHGAARDHVENVNDESLRPPLPLTAETCGKCHTGSHHPNFDEWETSNHAMVTESPAEEFEAGEGLTSCGQCHSGEYFLRVLVKGESLADDALAGVPREEQISVVCVDCHNPHQQTGNAANPEDGRDYQLRFPEAVAVVPTNTIEATTNPQRFNLCGQCHHERGRTWESTSRGPHHSAQSNVYAGEMAMPADQEPLVPSRLSVHSFAAEQCAHCHMYRQDFMDEEAPAIAGHTFQVNFKGCATAGCHPSQGVAEAAIITLHTEVDGRLDMIEARLGDPSTWQYSSEGGPNSAGQAMLSDNIKKVRFLHAYISADGSLGVHNPDYVRDMLEKAEELLDDEGL